MSTQEMLWWGAGTALAVAAFAAFAEHRRSRRRDLDRVGVMPWNFIQVVAILCFMLSAALALQV